MRFHPEIIELSQIIYLIGVGRFVVHKASLELGEKQTVKQGWREGVMTQGPWPSQLCVPVSAAEARRGEGSGQHRAKEMMEAIAVRLITQVHLHSSCPCSASLPVPGFSTRDYFPLPHPFFKKG